MQKLLVLGAGIYQVPLIETIKRMGIYCIVSSIPGDYPGLSLADKVYYENTTDAEAILRIATEEQVDGILTTGTDVAVKSIGYVCDRLKLNGISCQSAEYTTDKALMKRKLLEGGVKTGAFEAARTEEDALRITRRLGMPVMFKCVDKSGSRGIIKVESEDQILEAFHFSLSYSDRDYIVIEKFLEGYEIGIDGFVCGDQRTILPHAKLMHGNGKTKVPVGHIFPFACSPALQADIELQTNRAIDALGLDHCFFNIDAMIDGDECFIIEIGGRTGATCIPELAGIYLGSDYYEKMVENALGLPVAFHAPCGSPCAGKLLQARETGTITDIVVPEHPDGQVSLDYQVGDSVRAFQIGPDRIGQLVVSGTSTEDACRKLEQLDRQIVIRVNPANT